jgi:hypothetical protein
MAQLRNQGKLTAAERRELEVARHAADAAWHARRARAWAIAAISGASVAVLFDCLISAGIL